MFEYKILTNSIYIGTFAYGKYRRKEKDILYVKDYCEPIIDEIAWDSTRNMLEKNKHSNYGEFINVIENEKKNIIHLRCKNHNYNGYGLNYNTEKIEYKLKRFLDELTLFM